MNPATLEESCAVDLSLFDANPKPTRRSPMSRVCCNKIAGFCLAALAGPVLASVVYNEANPPPIGGDLSNDWEHPTAITVVANDNLRVIGTTGRPNDSAQPPDRDYFTIDIPVGQGLFELNVVQLGTTVAGSLGSFIGVRAGNVGTNPGASPAAQAADLWGYFLYKPDSGPILDDLAHSNLLTPPAQGFVAPLTAGSYTFWIQEGGLGSSVTYEFDLVLQSVPEPSTILLIGLAGIALRRRRVG